MQMSKHLATCDKVGSCLHQCHPAHPVTLIGCAVCCTGGISRAKQLARASNPRTIHVQRMSICGKVSVAATHLVWLPVRQVPTNLSQPPRGKSPHRSSSSLTLPGSRQPTSSTCGERLASVRSACISHSMVPGSFLAGPPSRKPPLPRVPAGPPPSARSASQAEPGQRKCKHCAEMVAEAELASHQMECVSWCCARVCTSPNLSDVSRFRCDWRQVRCQYCNMAIIRRDIGKHETKCRERQAQRAAKPGAARSGFSIDLRGSVKSGRSGHSAASDPPVGHNSDRNAAGAGSAASLPPPSTGRPSAAADARALTAPHPPREGGVNDLTFGSSDGSMTGSLADLPERRTPAGDSPVVLGRQAPVPGQEPSGEKPCVVAVGMLRTCSALTCVIVTNLAAWTAR